MLNAALTSAAGSLLFAGWATAGLVTREIIHPRQVIYPNYINATNSSNSDVALHISTQGGGRNATAPLLYGWMFEDISVRRIVHWMLGMANKHLK